MVGRAGAVLLLCAALAGCITAAPPVADGPAMEPAPLPVYAVGDTFTYDNGRSETVEAVNAETGMVKWRRGRSSIYYAPPNFIVPDIRWSTRRTRGRFDTRVAMDAMWPLVPGSEEYFVGTRESQRKGQSETRLSIRAYDCRVNGTTTLVLAIGTFDTYKVVCRRLTRGRSLSRVYHWYYAPAVGHYVQKDTFDRYGSLRSSVKLASVLRADGGLSDVARAGRNTLLTEALETWPSGTTRDWQDPAGGIGVAVTVAGTFKTEGGAFCRRYQQAITVGNDTRVDPGIACRTEGGWQRI